MADSKNDLNRLGIFQEMAYISIQDPYVPSSKCKLGLTICTWIGFKYTY